MPSSISVKEWLETWVRDYTNDVKPSTSHLYEQQLNDYIIPRIGAVRLQELDGSNIQRCYNQLLAPPKNSGDTPLSPKTVRCIHGTFHKALGQAVTNGFIRKNPSDACALPKIIKKDIQPLSEEQVAQFFEVIKGHPHEFLYKLTLLTGLREGEVLGLSWNNVDLKSGTIIINQQLTKDKRKGGQYYFTSPKNNKGCSIAVGPSVVELLKAQQHRQEQIAADFGEGFNENNLVFTNPIGDVLSYRTVYYCYKRIVTKMGIPHARFHDLRHTYAVLSIKNGDDIKTVQDNLGHATAAFTLDVYGHTTAEMKRASANRMETFIGDLLPRNGA